MSFLMLSTVFDTFAQDYYPPDTTKITSNAIYRLKAGLNLSNQYEKDNEESYDGYIMKPGFHIGFTAEFPSTETVSFESGVLISTKGYKSSVQYPSSFNGTEYYEGSENLIYLEIPLTAKFYYRVDKSIVYGIIGPYCCFGLGGKDKLKVTYGENSHTDTEKITFGSGEDDWYKIADFGLIAGGGFEMRRVQVSLTYNIGLSSISSYTEDGYKIVNRTLQLSFGYKFDL